MNQFFRAYVSDPRSSAEAGPCDGPHRLAARWLLVGLLALAAPTICHAENSMGTTNATASIQFRIVIPAFIRVSTITQPKQIVIEDRHITQGYIDVDVGTVVKITNNTRSGYHLAASYDSQILAKVEVKISGQNLTASSGAGSMLVATGIAVEKLVPISYRLHLASDVRPGDYRWPVSLAFSLTSV